ncbi:MAG: bifunctional oligoribonuclease/PAP phosphatase NrnA [Clostridia bacterium]|nr:bifunctional oligoribonuclease/PAP phosphatase NrnA [Clostridia bacterium]
MTNNTLQEIAEQLNKAKSVAVFCHARPDGDALGAGLATCIALQNAGKSAIMCCEDLPPEKFSFLPAMKQVRRGLPTKTEYDTFICVDCADTARMGIFSEAFSKFAGVTINIDHHVSNPGFAKYNRVVVCPASCEVLTDVLNAAKFEITKEIADLLMLGLITDSGNFTHCDVEAKSFETAAFLRGKGADVNLINYNMFSRQPKERAILYGRVMNGMRFALDDKLTFIVTSLADLTDTGADKSLTEGFVDFPLTVDGVEVSISLMETKKRHYKVSLRSKGKVNVNAVASTFGGGGHILASGCVLVGELEEVIEKLTYAVYQNL